MVNQDKHLPTLEGRSGAAGMPMNFRTRAATQLGWAHRDCVLRGPGLCRHPSGPPGACLLPSGLPHGEAPPGSGLTAAGQKVAPVRVFPCPGSVSVPWQCPLAGSPPRRRALPWTSMTPWTLCSSAPATGKSSALGSVLTTHLSLVKEAAGTGEFTQISQRALK